MPNNIDTLIKLSIIIRRLKEALWYENGKIKVFSKYGRGVSGDNALSGIV
jgi:hypothetical protein